jgi:hypothetical protein
MPIGFLFSFIWALSSLNRDWRAWLSDIGANGAAIPLKIKTIKSRSPVEVASHRGTKALAVQWARNPSRLFGFCARSELRLLVAWETDAIFGEFGPLFGGKS